MTGRHLPRVAAEPDPRGAAALDDRLAAEREAARRLRGRRRGLLPLVLATVAVLGTAAVTLPRLKAPGPKSAAASPALAVVPPQIAPTERASPPSAEPKLAVAAPAADTAPVLAAAAPVPVAEPPPVAAALAPVAPAPPVEPAPAVAPLAASPALPPAVSAAIALQVAPPSSAAAPAQVPSASAPAERIVLPAAELQRLTTRASELLRLGDISGARLLLGRAAASGDARAIFALAETYDPNRLAALGVRGIRGEPERAKALYAEALAEGVAEARLRLSDLR